MTCKECIHYDVCVIVQYSTEDYDHHTEYGCEDFKNKADYVEVVRCKDCKHWIYWADEKRCSCDLHHIRTHRDDFCSYGERK